MAAPGKSILVGAVVTVALAAACYGIWWGLGILTKRTLLGDFGMVLTVLVIFAFLSLTEIVLSRLLGDDGEPEA